jgi:tetratricopeptide (TPR) repeat protein
MFRQMPNGRFLPTLIFLTLLTLSAYAQTGNDLVHEFMNLENSDEKRLASLISADLFKLDVSVDSLDAIVESGIELAKNMGNQKSMFQLILIQTEARSGFRKDQIEQFENLIGESSKNGWDSLQLAGLYWKGRMLGMRNEPAKAIEHLIALTKREDKLIEKEYRIHAMVYEELALLKHGDGDLEGRLAMYQAAFEINEANDDPRGMCSNLINLGMSYIYAQDLENFRFYTDKSLAISRKLKRADYELTAYLNYASMFGMREMYDSCLVYALRANALSRNNRDKAKEAHSADIIAACYLNLDQLSKALKYQLKAYNLTELDLDKNRTALNVGLVYIEMKDYAKASLYYDTAIALAYKTNSDYDIPNTLNHIGYLRLEENKYQEALTSFKLANDKVALANNSFLENETYRGLAIGYQKIGNNKLSNEYVEKALGPHNSIKHLTELYKTQATNFEKLGDYKLAYQALENYLIYSDSLSAKSNKELEQTILAQYSVEMAENEVIITEKEKQLSDLNGEKQRRMKLFGFLLLGISLISIFIIVSRHKKFLAQRDKARKVEQESAQAIIDKSRNVLESQSDLILNKNRLIDELKSNLSSLFNDASLDVTKMHSYLDTKILTKDDWSKFKSSFTVVYPNFIKQASDLFPNLTASELRLLCLSKLGMSKQETADMLGVLPDSVKRTTNRFIQKFNIDSSLSLQEVVQTIG